MRRYAKGRNGERIRGGKRREKAMGENKVC